MRRALCLLLALLSLLLCACAAKPAAQADAQPVGALELAYAKNFRVAFYADGAALLTVGDGQGFLLLPEGAKTPAGLGELPVIHTPVKQVYLASSSAADLFLQAGALEAIRYSSTKTDDWKLPELQAAQERGEILYVGKYSAPDYEQLLTEGCDLAVENTMILHSPATKEKLEALGLPALIEYSSYEPHPLGRVEWVKLYGLLTGHLEEADAFFGSQLQLFESLEGAESTGKTVAFFHITANGAVVVRKQADYVTRMIELAGGETALRDLPESENALSTVTIQMESFYRQARDADVLIYNSTVAGDVESMDELLSLSPLLADFKAVQEGSVWCTEQSMFQKSSAAAGMIADFHAILTGAGDDTLQFLHKVG